MLWLWNRLNESYANPRVRFIVLGLIGLTLVYYTGRWLLRKFFVKAPAGTPGGPDPASAKAVYLARESARHVADSIATTANPLSSYYHAVHGHAMAGTARDIAPSAASLNAALGVDIHTFLEYTQRVVNEAEGRLVKAAS